MTPDDFFEEAPRKSSLVKIAIIEKYFGAWATIMLSKTRGPVCYVDLYAGEGAYADGTPSVPLRVVKAAVKDPRLSERLITIFNDREENTVRVLSEAIDSVPGVDRLRHKPRVLKYEVGTDDKNILSELPRQTPRLTLLDPFGYKGLSMDLIEALSKPPKSECIMLFNTNRIVAAVSNEQVYEAMSRLFGAGAFDHIRGHIDSLSGLEREEAILGEIKRAFRDQGLSFPLAFRFVAEDRSRTSHHLIHICRHPLGHRIMKEVMAREGSGASACAALFEYDPISEFQRSLFEVEPGVTDLIHQLAEQFAGRTLTVGEVYQQHHVGTPYIKGDYKRALSSMEEQGTVTGDPPRHQRPVRKGEPTLADDVLITFPEAKEK